MNIKFTQEQFNEIYNEGIENDTLNLTDSDIAPRELIESGIIKLMRQGTDLAQIMKIMIDASVELEQDFIDGRI
jgi:hypothetical protein